MKTIGLSDSSITDVLHVLAGILMIGNIEFVSTGGAQVQDKSGKEDLLGLCLLFVIFLTDTADKVCYVSYFMRMWLAHFLIHHIW